jgi:hypothetical protein
MESKKDFLGQELSIGDEVVFMQIKYRSFLTGWVVSMSEKKAKISHEKTNIGSTVSLQFYDQLIKIPKNN